MSKKISFGKTSCPTYKGTLYPGILWHFISRSIYKLRNSINLIGRKCLDPRHSMKPLRLLPSWSRATRAVKQPCIRIENGQMPTYMFCPIDNLCSYFLILGVHSINAFPSTAFTPTEIMKHQHQQPICQK